VVDDALAEQLDDVLYEELAMSTVEQEAAEVLVYPQAG